MKKVIKITCLCLAVVAFALAINAILGSGLVESLISKNPVANFRPQVHLISKNSVANFRPQVHL